jgi:hypothetical protein
VAVGWLARSVGSFAKAKNGGLAVAHDTDHERWQVALQKKDRTGEFNRLF